MSFRDIVDRQIDKGRRQGLFDDLPGHGKPIADLGRRREPGWWADSFVRNERARVRDEDLADRIRLVRGQLRRAADERSVTRLVEQVNGEIAEHNRLSRDTQIQHVHELSLTVELEAHRRRK